VFSVVYEAVGPTLVFSMLALVLLWRNDTEMQKQQAAAHVALASGGAHGKAGLPAGVRG
jgi:hypothetical protein